ncbi:hypothetical protein [Sabulibacter ruber]|uniref:hypothetical protein n=1 Tax=Sabulibacter ruber TaxID=2811901 RepID=UPI001A975BA5|nr:hypothetical protein [Sabulibacter ruber]
MKRILLFVVALTSLLTSCGDEEITRDPDSVGYQYYPLEVGRYWIFNVTENKYTNNIKVETTAYQTMERIDTVLKDQTGKEWYRVELSRRADASSSWVINGVKLISLSSSDLRVQENNQTTVQMVFPVKNGYSFISNGFQNSEDPVYYTYENLGQALSEDGLSYDNTLTVIRADFDKLLDLDEAYTILATEVGPVKRSVIFYEYCNSGQGTNCEVGTDYIVSGSDKTEILESTGIEE